MATDREMAGAVAIQGPLGRVVHDIFTNANEGDGVPDHMFVVISLPDGDTWIFLMKPCRDTDFEPPNNGTDGFGCTVTGGKQFGMRGS
jgi:hypothetical protein